MGIRKIGARVRGMLTTIVKMGRKLSPDLMIHCSISSYPPLNNLLSNAPFMFHDNSPLNTMLDAISDLIKCPLSFGFLGSQRADTAGLFTRITRFCLTQDAALFDRKISVFFSSPSRTRLFGRLRYTSDEDTYKQTIIMRIINCQRQEVRLNR